jgi:hypothetical protein
LTLLVSSLLACPASAQEPIVDNDFNLDLVTGPVLGSDRVVALGGAFTALATSIDGAAWNPASYGSRTLWEPNWFEWDFTVGILLPGAFSRNDYFNNGEPVGTGPYDFVFFDTGLRLQFAYLGVGGLFRIQNYMVDTASGPADVNTWTVQYGGAWMFLDGQLVAGLGGRTVGLSITHQEQTLVEFGGTGIEAGLVWRPAGWPFRIGAAGRTPVFSEQVVSEDGETVDEALGFVLPKQVYQPWEAQAGIAVQIGKRPFNRRWKVPEDPHDEMLTTLKAHWCEREREQAIRELEAEGKSAELAGMCPRLVRRPQDRQWWYEEKQRRRRDEEAVDDRIEHRRDMLRLRMDAEYASLPRFYWLITADVLVIGASPDAVGIDGFLEQELRRVGQEVSVGVRLGSEIELWPGWIKLRGGGYMEPGRAAGVGPRFHGTAGLDLRLFTWDLFGWVDPFTVRVGGMVDFASRYFNWGVGVGLWH